MYHFYKCIFQPLVPLVLEDFSFDQSVLSVSSFLSPISQKQYGIVFKVIIAADLSGHGIVLHPLVYGGQVFITGGSGS